MGQVSSPNNTVTFATQQKPQPIITLTNQGNLQINQRLISQGQGKNNGSTYVDSNGNLRYKDTNGQVSTVNTSGNQINGDMAFADTSNRIWPILLNGHEIERCEINNVPMFMCTRCDKGLFIENKDIELIRYFFGRMVDEGCNV